MSVDHAPRDGLFGRILQTLARIEPHERREVFTAFVLFFCVLCGYFMLRPVRETIGTTLGEENVNLLFTATGAATLIVFPLYGWACSKLPRTIVLAGVYGLFGLSLLVLAVLMGADPGDRFVAGFFYVWISVFNLMIVSVFWTLMVDKSTAEQAKRLFGTIAAGGTAGGLAGPAATALLSKPLGATGILVISAMLFGVAILCHVALVRTWRLRPLSDAGQPPLQGERVIGGNPFAGLVEVVRSPYLLLFAVFYLLLSSATTFLYFDQLRLFKEVFPDEGARTQAFANVDLTVQVLALVTQLFFTSRIASRLGVVVLLACVPVAMVFGFVTLAIVGNFWVLVVAMVIRRAGEYALTRPGREILFTAVDTGTKYKAKNFLDVVVYRFGDMSSSWLRTGLKASGLTFTWLAVVGAGIALLWALVGLRLGRQYEERSARMGSGSPAGAEAR